MTVSNENKYLDPLPLSKSEVGGKGLDIETPPVTELGTMLMAQIQSAFDEWSEAITGCRADVMQSSHGRAFIAGWMARRDCDT